MSKFSCAPRAASLILSLALTSAAVAQWNPLNPVAKVKQQGDGVLLAMQYGTLRLRVCSDSIVRVTYSASATFPDAPEFVIIKTSWPAVPWTKDVALITARLKVTITRKDGAILFTDAAGKKLFEDFDRTLTPVEVNGEKMYHSEMFSNLWDSTEGFYGLGQHQAGVWNYHGESVDLSQDNTNISIPMFLSSNGYGIYWNNPSRSKFNNRFPHALYLSSEVADTVDYYFLYGPNFDKIIASYREMTGAAPMFGKWAYGLWQCKNKYESQAELLGIAHKYRALHIPVDNIVQDWFWWNTMGEPVFNKNYPDPKGMIDDLHQNHFVRALVRVWRVLPNFPSARHAHDEPERAVVVWVGSADDFDKLRPATLPADAVYLLAGVEDDERELHADAPAGDGFPRRHLGAQHW
jgi:alpha-D-xyloside xylohydrolase